MVSIISIVIILYQITLSYTLPAKDYHQTFNSSSPDHSPQLRSTKDISTQAARTLAAPEKPCLTSITVAPVLSLENNKTPLMISSSPYVACECSSVSLPFAEDLIPSTKSTLVPDYASFYDKPVTSPALQVDPGDTVFKTPKSLISDPFNGNKPSKSSSDLTSVTESLTRERISRLPTSIGQTDVPITDAQVNLGNNRHKEKVSKSNQKCQMLPHQAAKIPHRSTPDIVDSLRSTPSDKINPHVYYKQESPLNIIQLTDKNNLAVPSLSNETLPCLCPNNFLPALDHNVPLPSEAKKQTSVVTSVPQIPSSSLSRLQSLGIETSNGFPKANLKPNQKSSSDISIPLYETSLTSSDNFLNEAKNCINSKQVPLASALTCNILLPSIPKTTQIQFNDFDLKSSLSSSSHAISSKTNVLQENVAKITPINCINQTELLQNSLNSHNNSNSFLSYEKDNFNDIPFSLDSLEHNYCMGQQKCVNKVSDLSQQYLNFGSSSFVTSLDTNKSSNFDICPEILSVPSLQKPKFSLEKSAKSTEKIYPQLSLNSFPPFDICSPNIKPPSFLPKPDLKSLFTKLASTPKLSNLPTVHTDGSTFNKSLSKTPGTTTIIINIIPYEQETNSEIIIII